MSLTTHDLRSYVDVPMEKRFAKVLAFIESSDPTTERKPRKVPELYLKVWNDFLQGRQGPPDVYAMRQLCWEPTVAATPQFLKHLVSTRPDMNPRSIRGLVHSLHMKWESGRPDADVLSFAKRLLVGYVGYQKAMGTWKSVPEEVVGPTGPELFAKRIVGQHRPVHEAFKERSFHTGTEYYEKTLRSAVDMALDGFSYHSSAPDKAKEVQYLFSDLLSLPDMPPETFKKGIVRLILSDVLNRYPEFVDRVKDGILQSDKLGDPRISTNGLYWAGISEDAKSKVIEWLSRADIVFFFEHVMTQGAERQGRKEFWLRYVKGFTRTRCLLGKDDRARLVPLFRTSQKAIEGYGRIGGQTNNSAFLLDFGNVLAIEFSRVGACFLYERANYPKHVEDFWTDEAFSEPALKDRYKCAARVIHMGAWQINLANALARFGIRPR